MEKTWNSGESSQKWPAYKTSSKSKSATLPSHKRAQTSMELQAVLASDKVSIHDATTRKTLDKNGNP